MPLPILTPGVSRRGARLGRASHPGHRPDGSPWDKKNEFGIMPYPPEAYECERTFYLQDIGPDEDGYDAAGAYWGLQPQNKRVYWAYDEETEAQHFVTAVSIEMAERAVKERYPNATFHPRSPHEEYRHAQLYPRQETG